MILRSDVLIAIVMMAVATYFCRAAGFFAMGRVPITPRVEAWLKAIPIALIGAIVGPLAFRGGPPEWAGLAVSLILMFRLGNDFIAVIAGLIIVVGLRQLF